PPAPLPSTLSLHDALPIWKHAKQLAAEVAALREQLGRLGAMDVAELERQRAQLQQQIAAQEQELRDREERHRAEISRLQHELNRSEEHTSELQSREKLVCR